MNPSYVELDRLFEEIDPDKDSEISAYESYFARLSTDGADKPGWSALLVESNPCLVVLGEPGSGKTFELGAAADKLRRSGRVAVMFDIVSMVNAIEPPIGDVTSMAPWRAGTADAWLFLDAVDESKLVRASDFHTALGRIAAWVGTQRKRTHYVISSRITEWRHAVDKFEIERKLGVTPKILKLSPLTEAQVNRLVSKGGDNSQEFCDAVEQADAWEFVGRPQDALDLHGVWFNQTRLGTKTELLEFSSVSKLRIKEDPSGLSPERLRQGVEYVCACLHLTRTLSIAIDDVAPTNSTSSTPLAQCLPTDWSDKERRALVQRPLFNDATFGHIRLHHRTHQDYLAACWLRRLMASDCPYSELQQLIFEDDGLGRLTLRPFMKSVAAWLACISSRLEARWVAQLLADLSKHAPWAFLKDGDPQALTLDYRRSILRSLVELYHGREHVQFDWDDSTLKRFAHPDLAPDISTWIADKTISSDVRASYIMLVRYGNLESAMAAVVDVALDESAHEYLRGTALRCIARSGSIAHRSTIFRSAQECNQISLRLVGAFALCGYPSLGDEIGLFKVLGNITEKRKRHHMTSLDEFEREVVKNTDGISADRAAPFLSALLDFVRDAENRLRKDQAWAAAWIEPTVNRLLQKRELTSEDIQLAVAALEQLASAIEQNLIERVSDADKQGLTAHSLQHPALRRAWFFARFKRAKEYGKEPTHLFDLQDHSDLVQPQQQDMAWWLDEAQEPTNSIDWREFSLRAAFQLRRWSGTKPSMRLLLRSMKIGIFNPDLWSALREDISSYLMAPWRTLKYRWWNSRRAHYRLRDKRRDLTNGYWHLHNSVNFFLNLNRIESGRWWGACSYVVNLARQQAKGGSHSTWGSGMTSEDIDRPFGKIIGAAVRRGIDKHWRSYAPQLPHEKPDRNQTTESTVTGLIALDLAWQTGGELYFSSLTADEAQNAARYGLNELNGLPDWMNPLANSHKASIQNLLDETIRCEWGKTPASAEFGAAALGRISRATGLLPLLLLPTVLQLLLESEPENSKVLIDALQLTSRNEGDQGRNYLGALALQRLRAATPTQTNAWTWVTVLMQCDAISALSVVQSWLGLPEINPDDMAITLCGALGFRTEHGLQFEKPDYRRPQFLLRFIPWVFKHVKPSKDPVHADVYTPDTRDNAVYFRSSLVEGLKSSNEADADAVLLQLSAMPELSSERDWFKAVIDQRRAHRADDLRLAPSDLSDLIARDHDRAPRNRSDLFHVALRRIYAFKDDVERAEISIRHEARPEWREKSLQHWIQGKLDASRGNRYVIPAEAEIDPGKFPDLRFEHPQVDGAISVEIKLADQWSYADLNTGLHDQLVGQYLRAPNAKHGIYLLFYNGEKSNWQPTDHASKLDWQGLLADLQASAKQVRSERLDIEQLVVVGIDLRQPAMGVGSPNPMDA